MDRSFFERHPDMMNVYSGPELFQPYKTADGWLVVLPGEEDGRRQKYGKKLVAESKVLITVSDEENLVECIRVLEESDRRIRELSGGTPWDWQKVMIRGNQVRFGVAWYDREFFLARKESYKDPEHAKAYAKFGATSADFHVEHREVK